MDNVSYNYLFLTLIMLLHLLLSPITCIFGKYQHDLLQNWDQVGIPSINTLLLLQPEGIDRNNYTQIDLDLQLLKDLRVEYSFLFF